MKFSPWMFCFIHGRTRWLEHLEFLPLYIHKYYWCLVCWYCSCRVNKSYDLFIFPINAYLLNYSSCLTIHKGSKEGPLFTIIKWRNVIGHDPSSVGFEVLGKKLQAHQIAFSPLENDKNSIWDPVWWIWRWIYSCLALLRDPITLQRRN